MRRPTLIVLLVLLGLIAGAAALQLTQESPAEPYPGPVSGTPLPSGLTTAPPSAEPAT